MKRLLNELLENNSKGVAWGIFLVSLGFALVTLAYLGGFVLWGFLNFWGYPISFWDAVIGYSLGFVLLMLLPLRRSK